MPYRKGVLAQDQFYHVFNRGVASLPIFSSKKDYLRFLDLIDYYRFLNLPTSYSHLIKLPKDERDKIVASIKKNNNAHVEILSFCLMPNHFHFLLKQTTGNGTAVFIRNLQNSYAKYFNIKSKRAGSLFQSMFKAIRIETDEQLLHVSRYIHLNPVTGFLVEPEDLLSYSWSSLNNYLKGEFANHPFISPRLIINLFKTRDEYRKFIYDQTEYQRKLNQIKHLVFE